MPEHRLIAAMEEEVAARIVQVRREADEAIRRIEAEADQELAEAQRCRPAWKDRSFSFAATNDPASTTNAGPASAYMQFAIAEQVFGDFCPSRGRRAPAVRLPSDLVAALSEAPAAYHRCRNDIPNARGGGRPGPGPPLG